MPNPKEVDEAINNKFLTKDKFAEDIEKLKSTTGMTYIDCMVQYCEDNNIEPESVRKLISKPLKEKIEHESRKLHLLQKTNKESRSKLPL